MIDALPFELEVKSMASDLRDFKASVQSLAEQDRALKICARYAVISSRHLLNQIDAQQRNLSDIVQPQPIFS